MKVFGTLMTFAFKGGDYEGYCDSYCNLSGVGAKVKPGRYNMRDLVWQFSDLLPPDNVMCSYFLRMSHKISDVWHQILEHGLLLVLKLRAVFVACRVMRR